MNGQQENDTPIEAEGVLFLKALRATLGRTSIWILTGSVVLLLTLPLTLPWYSWFGEQTSHRYEPGSLVHSLAETFRQDHRPQFEALNTAMAHTGSAILFLAALFYIFAAGGWLQVTLERTHGQSLRRFFFGGSRYFWRFFRFWILTLLVLAALHWCLYEWPWNTFVLKGLLDVPEHDLADLETFDSELSVLRLGWMRDGAALIGFVLVMIWGTFSRTRLALHDTSSATWAGLCSFFIMLRHPLKTIRPLAALLIVELLMVTVVAGGLTRWLDDRLGEGPSLTTVVLTFVVGLLALLWREVTRGANYFAAVRVSQEVVRPLSRPDPWKAIGGPGGPQYPVDGGDEYGVAL